MIEPVDAPPVVDANENKMEVNHALNGKIAILDDCTAPRFAKCDKINGATDPIYVAVDDVPDGNKADNSNIILQSIAKLSKAGQEPAVAGIARYLPTSINGFFCSVGVTTRSFHSEPSERKTIESH